MSGGGERLCGEHGRSDDGSRPNREVAGAVSIAAGGAGRRSRHADSAADRQAQTASWFGMDHGTDRKSTRLNSSHGYISYAVFCLKKKKKIHASLLSFLTIYSPSVSDVISGDA